MAEAWLYDRLGERASHSGRHDRGAAGLQARATDEKARPFAVGEVISEPFTADGRLYPVGIVAVRGRDAYYCDLRGETAPVGDALARLAEWVPRGGMVVARGGATLGFHLLIRHLGVALAQSGWELYPLCSGSEIGGIVVKRGKLSLYMTDLERCTGWTDAATLVAAGDHGDPLRGDDASLQRLYSAVAGLQAEILARFGVALQGTVGATAVKAVRRSLPEGFVWWKPPALLSAMCGWGGALRGGYCYSERGVGEGWKVDITRAYTWALGQPLPARAAFCQCHQGDECQPGVYLARVNGHSELPVYLSVWCPDLGQFRKQHVTQYSGLTFLPQVEMAALAVAGYEVTPLWGFRWVQTLSLHTFTSRLAEMQAAFGRGSLESSTAKRLGNAFWGKLAQSPAREEVAYSLERPGAGWWPFVTVEQEVVPYLWARPVVDHRAYHHADAAAEVTARVRARSLAWLSEWRRRGGVVRYWDTDGGIVAPEPTSEYLGTADLPGEMRYGGYDPRARVMGSKQYTWSGRVHAAGLADVPSDALAMVVAGGRVTVQRRLLGRPWVAATSPESQPYVLG